MTEFQLDHVAVLKMHADWEPLAGGGVPIFDRVQSAFSLNIGRHESKLRQFRINFAARFQQLTKENEPVGYKVEAQLVGIATVAASVTEEKLSEIVHLNSVNSLYGTLRGLIVAATGAFPIGPFITPSLSAKDILLTLQPPKPTDEVKKEAPPGVKHRRGRSPSGAK